jgi:uncharacterized lipoprotein YajG
MTALKYLVAALATTMLASCQTTPVVMVNPETGKTVQCGPYYTGLDGGIGKGIPARESQCIQDYKEQGYVRK